MDELGMCLAFLNEGSEEPRWTPNEDEMGISQLDWLMLLTICFTGGFPVPPLAEFSPERAADALAYLKKHYTARARELMDFMKDEIADMVAEAWEATDGR